MNIQELSVGDWVRYRDREWQVCSLYQFTEEVGLWRKDSQFCETITDIQPIPLTPEILEKNGFKLFTEKHYGFIPDIEHPYIRVCDIKDTIKKNDVRIWMFEHRHNWCFHCINHGIGSSNNLGKAYITDVHELQHCLRLAKIDKEIKL